LIHFKVWVLYFKSDERSGIISEVFPKRASKSNNLYLNTIY